MGRDNGRVTPAFGVYVHIPFCATRCDYCDFATWTDREHLLGDYVDACVRDVARQGLPPATSVFFGGGTPSLLPARGITRILDAIERVDGAEVTVECNPDSVDVAKLREYRESGVNRVSFGVQSMRPHVLALLGRTHDPANVERAVDGARVAGIDRINLDLIYGTPGESVADWEATLDAALALEPEHISAYALTVEAGTPLGKAVAAGERAAPDDDDQARKYELADDRLTAAGLPWYEISNWARLGGECRHNLLYWAQGDYAAIGCAAHGHSSGRRWWNVRTPDRYIAAVVAGAPTEAADEVLDASTRAGEGVTLGIRTRAGIKLDAVPVDSPEMSRTLADLEHAELLNCRAGRLVLTRRGRLLANEVTAQLLLALEAPVARAGTR
jgi:oxygen-independent coproporphyrinogen-3 oxidase